MDKTTENNCIQFQDKKMVSRYTCTNNLSCLSEKIIIDIKIYFIMFLNRKNKLEELCKKNLDYTERQQTHPSSTPTKR